MKIVGVVSSVGISLIVGTTCELVVLISVVVVPIDYLKMTLLV